MAGYYDFKMSNNAIDAYASGEKPKSKWSKSDLLNAVPVEYEKHFRNFKLVTLKEVLLEKSSWHHTSCHYNRTDFYSVVEIDEDNVSELVKHCESIDSLVLSKKENPQKVFCKVKFLLWSGTRAHPRAEEVIEECEVIGNWAMTSYGRKSVKARGFEFL